jgi:hypothetical protein
VLHEVCRSCERRQTHLWPALVHAVVRLSFGTPAEVAAAVAALDACSSLDLQKFERPTEMKTVKRVTRCSVSAYVP